MVGFVGELCTLQDWTPPEYNGDCDALEEGSVTHQIKGEDGAMTGIQQVRPTLFHVFMFIFFENLTDLNPDEYCCVFWISGAVSSGVFLWLVGNGCLN